MHRLAASVLTIAASIAPLAHADGGLDGYSHDACLHGRLWAGHGAGDARFDADTGRDARNYAPDRLVDHLHMKLEIDIPDMNSPVLTARQTLEFAALATPVDAIRLDAEQLRILGVEAGAGLNSKVGHFHDGSTLTVTFDPPLDPGQRGSIVTAYELAEPVDGLFWTTESDAWPGRPAQIHTQGQPETNRFWFPCHDFPNEQLTTELVVTVPEGYSVISNGRLTENPTKSGGRLTFHWLQDKPHVNYLVTLVVGRFDVTDVAPAGFPIALPVHVPPGKGGLVRQTYGRTAEMVELFERVFDEPYPWDRYAQVVVWNFGAGGMENTSATTMYDTAVFDERALRDGDLDGLISHELAHQWTGDLITCNTWQHIWLNEGWATYGTALWYEQRDGYEDGYQRQMHQTMRGLARNDQLEPGSEGYTPAMASKVYEHPWEVFRRKANPYPKGSSVLHMLRMKLGDEVFFKGVAEYVDRYKFKTAETDDFRRVLEEVSGRSLEQFFDQWCYRAGTPKVKVSAQWDEAGKRLTIAVEQLQRIDAANPAFVFDLPIEVRLDRERVSAEAAPIRVTIPVDQRRHEQSIALDAAPAYLLVDPDLHVLMDLEIDIADAWLWNQVFTAGEVVPRLDAIEALGTHNHPTSIDILARVLSNESGAWYEQQLAAESLGKLKATEALLAALDAGIGDARPRAKALAALGNCEGRDNKEMAAAVLVRHASDENESYGCRAAALEALGKVSDGDAEHLAVFRSALGAESQHDQVRVGAIKGLARLDKPECLEMVAPFAAYGNLSRTRPEAIEAMASLADHDPKFAVEAIGGYLLDHEARTRRAARQALATIGDERGVALLDSFIARTRHPVEREDGERLRKELRKKVAERK